MTIACTNVSLSDFLIVRYNGQAVGRAYGTNAIAAGILSAVNPDAYPGFGGVCDCATGPLAPRGACANGG